MEQRSSKTISSASVIIVGAKLVKIAMLGHKMIPSRLGGVEVVVTELATRMAALGHDVTVYNRKSELSDYDHNFEYQGVRVREVPTINVKGLAAASSSFFATKAAIKDKPDIIHFHAEGPSAMIGLAKRAGIPAVSTIHGLDWQRAKWGGFATKYILEGEKVAAKKADQIIVLSEGVQTYFKNTYGRATTFIPNGIEPKTRVVAEVISREYGLHEREFILYLGRLVPEKGVHHLIEAYKRLETDKPLVIAGGSSDSADYCRQLHQAAEEDPRIIFTGFVEGVLLEELYSNAYAYVLPSSVEGMTVGLLEAMAYGNCCLVSDIAENVDVVRDHAIIFEKESSDSLVKTLKKITENSQIRDKYAEHAAQFITSRYDWNNTVQQTLEIYEQAINGVR